MNVTGVDFIAVPTRDFEKASDFYGNVLGLERSIQWGDMPAAEFETGSLTIAVMQSDAFGIEFSAALTPGRLHVDDVAAARDGARGAGNRLPRRHHGQRRLSHGPLRGPGRERADAPLPLRAPPGLGLTSALRGRPRQARPRRGALSCWSVLTRSFGSPALMAGDPAFRRKSFAAGLTHPKAAGLRGRAGGGADLLVGGRALLADVVAVAHARTRSSSSPRLLVQREPPVAPCSMAAGISNVLLRTVQPSMVPPPLAVLAT